MAKNAAGGHKAGKKNRKHKRQTMRSPSHKAYLVEGRCNKNKAKKITQHQKKHPNDKQEIGTKVDYTSTKFVVSRLQHLVREKGLGFIVNLPWEYHEALNNSRRTGKA